jgi:type VI protein secretion system component VasF
MTRDSQAIQKEMWQYVKDCTKAGYSQSRINHMHYFLKLEDEYLLALDRQHDEDEG